MYVLPNVDLYIEEFSELHHNELHGISTGNTNSIITSGVIDNTIDNNSSNVINQSSQITTTTNEQDDDKVNNNEHQTTTTTTTINSNKKASKKQSLQVEHSKEKEQMYYLIRCVDNGCGIAEENIGILYIYYIL